MKDDCLPHHVGAVRGWLVLPTLAHELAEIFDAPTAEHLKDEEVLTDCRVVLGMMRLPQNAPVMIDLRVAINE